MEHAYTDTNAGLHYDLRLNLNPRQNFIAVSGSLAYHSPQEGLERARFYLNHQFVIKRLEGRRVLGYHFENSLQPGQAGQTPDGVLDVYFTPPLRRGETALIQFDYQGHITEWPAESTNEITMDWAELNMQLPWFPIQLGGSQNEITFTLKVVCPAGYHVSSFGEHSLQDGAWFFNWPHPTTDIVVTAGTSLETRVYESEANRVFLSTSTFTTDASDQLGGDLLWILERYSGWFGPTRPSDFTVIESPRSTGGGYARRGLVVINALDEQEFLKQREAYLRYLAHEAAHAWWWEAPSNTWEDWLNESFAEYSALLVIRERFGQETFERFLARKRERVPERLPIQRFDREDLSSPEQQASIDRMLYDSGPLLLHELAERIGYQRFLELCRARLWGGVTDTAHFIDLLGELENDATKRWMEKNLPVS
jgi:hypothetical protein